MSMTVRATWRGRSQAGRRASIWTRDEVSLLESFCSVSLRRRRVSAADSGLERISPLHVSILFAQPTRSHRSSSPL